MDTGERLAAYAAGELGPEEARALEADLARDPSLRKRLARLRRLESTLGALPPVEVPAAFSEQLRTAVDRELADRPVGGDELAARRQRRGWGGLPDWFPAVAGAAAVLVAVVAVGAVVSGTGGGDDGDAGMSTTAMDGERADEEAAADSGAAGTESARSLDAPLVVDVGEAYDPEAVQALSDLDIVREVAGRALTDQAAAETADRYTAALGPDRTADTAGQDDAAPEEGSAESLEAPPSSAQFDGDVSDADLQAVRACLGGVLPEDEPVIPVYAELASFEGADAIVYGVVSRAPDSGAFTRVQLWVVDRDSCEVLYFAQDDTG